MNFSELCARVRDDLGQDHRYEHCVRVARMSDTLAQRHGADPAKARIAGMLHDLARLYSSQRLIEESERRAVPIDGYAREHPIVLHAPLGAHLARERYGIRDPEILSAITKHTLGSSRMSALDCILYLADGLEPGRDYPERAGIAALAYENLDAAMRASVCASMRYLREKRLPPAPQTTALLQRFGLE